MGDWEERRDGVGFDVRHAARKRLQGSGRGLKLVDGRQLHSDYKKRRGLVVGMD